MKKNNRVRTAALIIAVITALSGCSHPTSENNGSAPESIPAERETESGAASGSTAQSEGKKETASESTAGAAGSEKESSPEQEAEKAAIQQKIVTATDIHYLAESLAGDRCESFMSYVNTGDGRVLQYGWEILDAFIEDMLKEKPDLVVLSGDLTLNGEKESHEELAEKLQILLENDVPVIVIPGNHDINNPNAKKFSADGEERTDSVTAEEFASIYADYGYVAADSRDTDSLSYTYKIDDYYWLLMLDSCQYDPVNQIGGMIRPGTYDWLEGQLEDAWDQGAQVISVSHHNLLDQSGVSPDFYDNCTIEHNEQLVQTLSDGLVRLHLSGHLHLQHYMENEDSGIWEIVTGSLVMAPCRYGSLLIMDTGDFRYSTKPVNVSAWAKAKGYKNSDLTDFDRTAENFLRQVTYRNATEDLRRHTSDRKLFLSDERIEEMARFYAELCVHYYGGRMYELAGTMKNEKAYGYWDSIDYVSDLSTFLKNILNDDAKDFSHLEIPY